MPRIFVHASVVIRLSVTIMVAVIRMEFKMWASAPKMSSTLGWSGWLAEKPPDVSDLGFKINSNFKVLIVVH
jgi:hypothetical protein